MMVATGSEFTAVVAIVTGALQALGSIAATLIRGKTAGRAVFLGGRGQEEGR
jgi:hypothetical protein